MCIVSIVIPCYNHGQFIDEAIKSVELISDKSIYEIIIVNDGSTDGYTNLRLKELKEAGYNVIFQENSGLAKSRNNGIAASKGKYILPLDADNKIRPEFVYEGCKILNEFPDVNIVYGDAQTFGDEEGFLKQGEYNLQKLMITNYIDACAMYRKEVWEKTGGYDFKMPYQGVEDWAMWMHASFLGMKFHYLNKIVFDYRVLGNSMIRELRKNKIKGNANIEYLINKHPQYFGPQFIDADIMSKFESSPIGFLGKILLKKYFPKSFINKVEKGDLRKYI